MNVGEKSMKYERPSVRIRKDQLDWLREQGYNISKWVRKKIAEEMNKEPDMEVSREEIKELRSVVKELFNDPDVEWKDFTEKKDEILDKMEKNEEE